MNDKTTENTEVSKNTKEPWDFEQYFWFGAKFILFSHLVILICLTLIYFANSVDRIAPRMEDFLPLAIAGDVMYQLFSTPLLVLSGIIYWAVVRRKEALGFLLGIIACSGIVFVLSIMLCSFVPESSAFNHG